MRLSYLLLAAALTLTASYDPVSAAVSTTDSVESIESVQIERSGKRFLRATKTNQQVDDDTEDLKSAEEERIKPIGLTIKIPEWKLPPGFYTHPLLRPLDDVLASVKSPTVLNKMGQNIQAKMDENSIAKSFVNQFIDEQWSTQLLKENLGIKKLTSRSSEQYQALALLLQVRSYNNVLAKTGWKTNPLVWRRSVKTAVGSLNKEGKLKFGEALRTKLENNPIAKAFAEQNKNQEWTMPLLVKKLGITTETPSINPVTYLFAPIVTCACLQWRKDDLGANQKSSETRRHHRPGTPVGRQPSTMSRPALKDDKERYLTYSITVRAANKEQGIEEEVVTKKMPKFLDGGPMNFLEWVYHFNQLATLKSWNVEDKFLNITILLEGDLHEAFVDASLTDDDTRMDEEFTRALRKASILVLTADYSEKIQEELWEVRKARSESLTEYSKRFGHYGQVYSTLAALVTFFERIEQGEQRLHRQDKMNNNHESSRGQGHRSSNNYRNRDGNNTAAVGVSRPAEVLMLADATTTPIATTLPAASTAPFTKRPLTTQQTVAPFATTIIKKNTSKLIRDVGLAQANRANNDSKRE
ncbi:hypothetical protein ON010_g10166 [Phytophthora cinnamomi]|nr:hypothetical protein ON010_g10166 [Phytophthora cinnamomi]